MSGFEGWAIRPADPDKREFVPADGKVIAWVRITFEYPVEVDPSYLEPAGPDADYPDGCTAGTWHRSEGTWCPDNFTDEIAEAVEMERRRGSFETIQGAMHNGGLDDFVVGRVTVERERKGTAT